MNKHNIQILKDRRRELRHKPTPEELVLWDYLRRDVVGVRFRRQFSIGYYIADFYCPKKKLVIEVDGGYHVFNKEYDEERDRFFASEDVNVLRFNNADVMNRIGWVMARIQEAVK
jgi:very-short-patch-repair endonuclease